MKVFHAFRLDTVNQCLWREQARVAITPKAYDVLRYLVERSNRLVTQDEMLEALWPDTYVNPELIKKYIREVRRVLGDEADQPRFIETFPKRGYRFIAPVTDPNPISLSGRVEDETGVMVGRESALNQLDIAFTDALRGKRQIVFVTGEAGIGKTTLLDAFRRRIAQTSNLRIARGQCVEGFGGKEAYYPLFEALRQLLQQPDALQVRKELIRLAPTWLIQFPSVLAPEEREMLQRELLGSTRERMVRELCEALEVLAAEIPLVLMFEDLHWVDPATLDVISAVARRRNPAKLMLLGTYRPADIVISKSPLKGLKQDLLAHRLGSEIALEPLEEIEIVEYVDTRFPRGSFAASLARLVSRQSGGNALFMVALIEEMQKRGIVVEHDGGWILTMPVEKMAPTVPDTLQQMLASAFEQLSAIEQRILSGASVAGERFSVWTIAGVFDLGTDQIEDVCEGLFKREQFIRAAGIRPLINGFRSAHYEFRHALYRQAIYRQLSDVARVKLHRAIGERLLALSSPAKPELAAELAEHFEQGQDYQRAIEYLMLVAQNATQRFAHKDSIQTLQYALTLVPLVSSGRSVEMEMQMLERIGDDYYALGAMQNSVHAYEYMASRAAETGLKAAHVNALCALTRPLGFIDPDRGIAGVKEAVRISSSVDDRLFAATTELLGACIRLVYDSWTRQDAEVATSSYETLRSLDPGGAPSYHLMLYALVEALQGRERQALTTLQSGIPMASKITAFMVYFFALSGLTVTHLRLGQFGEVLGIVRAGREAAEKDGTDPWLFNFREAWLRVLALDFEGAWNLCTTILNSKTEYPTAQPKTIALVAAGYAELGRGNPGQAVEHFTQVRDPRTTPKFFLHWYWRMNAQLGLSEAWLQAGDLAGARSEGELFLKSALSTADPNLHVLAWEIRTRLAMAEGNVREARENLDQALSVLAKFDVPLSFWKVHKTAWNLLETQDVEAAESHRKQAEAGILKLANSLPSDEPLREIFLGSEPLRRVLNPGRNRKTRPTRSHT